jgi:hypothetical protein
MTEQLLQYIWKHQLYHSSALETTAGESLEIVFPGHWNHHQGPDFSLAKVRINGTTLVGNIELHLKASDWYAHKHQEDQQYQNVILHVVWKADAMIQLSGGINLAVLDLSSRIPRQILYRYEQWLHSPASVPCGGRWDTVSPITITAWKDRLMVERWLRKIAQFRQPMADKSDWDTLLWHMLAANFGLKANTDLFESIARSIPYKLIAKTRQDPMMLEALLMGQAHLLDQHFSDAYAQELQQQYRYLKHKYQLSPAAGYPVFLRMRPAAFPTIRLAQLAILLHRQPGLFRKILEASNITEVQSLFTVSAADYWCTHYRFDEASAYQQKKLGADMILNLCINTAIPILFYYGQVMQDAKLVERAMDFMMQLPAEANRVIRFWQETGIRAVHALDSQSLMELHTQYCHQKRCLECVIGHALLRTQ